MRTTVTLDPDVEAMLRREMRKRGISFKKALNEAIRHGLIPASARTPKRFRQKTFSLGFRPGVNIDKALSLAASLEDEEILRKLEVRK